MSLTKKGKKAFAAWLNERHESPMPRTAQEGLALLRDETEHFFRRNPRGGRARSLTGKQQRRRKGVGR